MSVQAFKYLLAVGLLTAQPFISNAFAEERQRPGSSAVDLSPFIYESIVPEPNSSSEFVAVPDRWRQFYAGKWYDPYNQSVLKGDVPVFGAAGHEWFVELTAISDTSFEHRRLPVPVGGVSSERADSNDPFGSGRQNVFVQNLVTSFSLIRGNTTFKPPEFELRIVPVFNFNHLELEETVVRVDPAKGSKRDDGHVAIQELFIDLHLANLSERYDFISSRVGIQRFNSDFRGFVFASDEPGARLFGNFDNNRYQFNSAYFRRIDKDTNSGLNSVFDDRYEDLIVANLYRQDAPVYGHTLGVSYIYRQDLAGSHADHYDDNGLRVRPAIIGDGRPKNIYTNYLGLFGDGHFGRINTSSAFYYVYGSETHNQIAARSVDISAAMAAFEMSYDIDWIRLRSSVFWASGDSDPFDSKANGFDAISDNPNFAGGELSFWQRQGIGLIGGGGVNLVNRASLLPNLRAGKEEGQSNFVNPGLRLLNLGFDIELTPRLKLISNASYLEFDETAVLEAIRQDGSLSRSIGYDFSTGLLYRPYLNNNLQLKVGAATLIPLAGIKGLYGDDRLYSLSANVILQY